MMLAFLYHRIGDGKYANSPLGLYLDVDLEIISVNYILDPLWTEKLNSKQLSESEMEEAYRNYNNVVKEIRMIIKVVK